MQDRLGGRSGEKWKEERGSAELTTPAAREKAVRIERFVASENKKFLDEIRPKLKDVKGFWTVALLNHPLLNARVSAVSDRDALQHLSDIELVQDPKDPREYELVFVSYPRAGAGHAVPCSARRALWRSFQQGIGMQSY